jgi:hypothetical protein
MAEKVRLSFAEVLAKTEKISEHQIYVEELGGCIPYCDLTVEDFAEIYQKRDEDPLELSVKAFYKAWHKADPTVTLEAVKKKIPLRILLKVINEVVPGLFQTAPLGTLPVRQSAEQSTS